MLSHPVPCHAEQWARTGHRKHLSESHQHRWPAVGSRELTTLSFSILMCHVNYRNISNAWRKFMHDTAPGRTAAPCGFAVSLQFILDKPARMSFL